MNDRHQIADIVNSLTETLKQLEVTKDHHHHEDNLDRFQKNLGKYMSERMRMTPDERELADEQEEEKRSHLETWLNMCHFSTDTPVQEIMFELRKDMLIVLARRGYLNET